MGFFVFLGSVLFLFILIYPSVLSLSWTQKTMDRAICMANLMLIGALVYVLFFGG